MHGIVGLAEGLRYVMSRSTESLRGHELDLTEQMVRWAEGSGLYRVHGKFDRATHVGTISLTCPELPATEIGAILDEAFQIAVRPGLHCAPYVHRELGTFPDGTIRLSPGLFNTVEDIQAACTALEEIAKEVSSLR